MPRFRLVRHSGNGGREVLSLFDAAPEYVEAFNREHVSTMLRCWAFETDEQIRERYVALNQRIYARLQEKNHGR